MRTMAITLVLGGALLVGACAKQEPITEEELQRLPDLPSPTTDEPDTAPVEDEQAAAETEQSEGDGPALQAIALGEADDAVEAGLGCAYINSDNETLFLASAPTETDSAASAAVKLNDTIVALTAETLGGYGALQQGGVYASEALSVTIERASSEGETVGIETMEWPASLSVSQDEGGTTVYEGGRYSCGA